MVFRTVERQLAPSIHCLRAALATTVGVPVKVLNWVHANVPSSPTLHSRAARGLRSTAQEEEGMVRRLWGCYSVADHLADRAFVADLLLYDRLVVPVPSEDDRARWEERWNPTRQTELLKIIEPFVKRIVWSAPLREQFEHGFSPALASFEIDSVSAHAARRSPYEVTRRVITNHLRGEVAAEQGDVCAVAVYAQPDRFDREWELKRTFPFLRRRSMVEPGELREVAQVSPADQQRLAKLVVTRLVVPDDGEDDKEVLKRTVDLISKRDVSERRAAFQELLARLTVEGLRDETIVGEVQDLLEGLNEAVKRRTNARRARTAVQVFTVAEGAAALWAPPVALAAGPTAASADAVIERRWEDTPTANFGAVSLLADAQRALRS